MSKSIYFVGKPYPRAYDLPAFKGQGYRLGVLLDKTVSLKNRHKYDDIIEVDFTSTERILESANRVKADGLICTYENYILAKAQLAAALKLPAQSIASGRLSTDKLLMRQAFMESDPSITPRFGTAQTAPEALRLAEKLGYPLIIKPTNLVKSLLVLKCDNPDELERNFAYAQQAVGSLYLKHKIYGRKPQLIVEEFVSGKTCSIAAFVDAGGQPHFCEGVAGLVNAQDINIDDNYIYKRYLPAEFDESLKTGLFEAATKGIKALQMSSVPAHVELIYDDTDVKLIEIGARIGGYRPRMYSTSYGIDMIAQEVRLALGEQPKIDGDLRSYCAVFELFPQDEGKFQAIKNQPADIKFGYYSVKALPGQAVGPAKKGYKAAAIVIVNSPDKKVFDKMCDKVADMKVVTE